MIESADDVLEYLDEAYGSATAARGLWQWAGGSLADVAWGETIDETWAGLWGETDEACGVGRLALVREMLFERPGHPILLEFLAETALTVHEPATAFADGLVFALDRLRPFGFDMQALRPYLEAFPGETWEGTFAVMAPALQEWGSYEDRRVLGSQLAATSAFTQVVERVAALREDLRAVDGEGRDAARAAIAELHELTERLEALGDEPDSPRTTRRLAKGLRGRLVQTVARLEFRRDPTAKSVVAGLSSFLARGRKLHDEGGRRLAQVAEGLRLALLCTREAADD